MAEVIATDEFATWYAHLNDQEAEAVEFVVELLEKQGIALGFPYSSKLEGTKINLRELRAQSGGKPLRVSYSFDPKRQAVLLLGGDKTGKDRFYKQFVAESERIWEQYLKEQSRLSKKR